MGASLEAALLLCSITGDCGCTPLAPDSVCCRAFVSGAGLQAGEDHVDEAD